MATSNFINYKSLPIVAVTYEDYEFIGDEIEKDIDDFNMRILDISERLYYSKRDCDRQESIALDDVRVMLIDGYYVDAQLGLKHEYALKYINKTHRRMILSFFKKIAKKYGLKRYVVSAQFSNGETFYQEVK